MNHQEPTLNENSADPATIARYWDHQVVAQVRYAYEHSAYYRSLYDRASVDVMQITRAADLPQLPTVSKRDIAEHDRQFWAVSMSEVIDVVTTSGSTGRPLVYPLTERDLQRLGRNEALSFDCVGVGREDVVILGVTLDRCIMAGRAYELGLQQLGAAVVRVGSGSPALMLEMIHAMQASVVVSVPSFLLRVADYAEQRGMDLNASPVGKLVCIGEPVRDPQTFALSGLGQLLAERWGAGVYSTYGATELASSMCECEHGCGGHLHPQMHYVELLDAEGQPVSEGELGELTVTPLGVQGMPLVRYRLGDVCRMYRQTCACGRCTPRIGPVEGRMNQLLKLKGTSVYPTAVGRVLERIEQVVDYLMLAGSDHDGLDRLDVHLALKSGADASVRVVVEEAIRGVLKVRPHLHWVDEPQIRAMRGRWCPESRKVQRLIDLRKTADHD